MSRYKWSLIAFILILLPSLAAMNILATALIIISYVTLLGIMAFWIQSNFYINAIHKIKSPEKIIALSFDDGPCREKTPLLLDILKENNIQAIFFCIGSKIQGNEDILKRTIKEGHLIANHSYSHSTRFDFYSTKRIIKEIEKTKEELFKATGLHCKLFRPPYGVVNPMVANAITETHQTIIGWSNRSLDTITKNKNKVVKRIVRKLSPGDIILLHDTTPFSSEILKDLLIEIASKGYKVKRLDQVIDLHCYEN